jgi:hypothetical protein
LGAAVTKTGRRWIDFCRSSMTNSAVWRRVFLRREHGVSLQTTELVHEAYFKLTDQRSVDWENRGQFFAIAAQAMRRLLIDSARQRKSLKRSGEKNLAR